MKKLFSFLAILISLQGISQTRYIPNNPDALYLSVTINGTVRKVLVGDLHKNVNLRIDSTATAIGNKVDKITGKGLSTNDYSDAEKAAVAANSAALAATEEFDPTLYAPNANPTFTGVAKINTDTLATKADVRANSGVGGTAVQYFNHDCRFGSANPFANSATYYFGVPRQSDAPATTANQRIFAVPVNCTLIGYSIATVSNGVTGSSETASVYLRVNNTTDNLLSSAVTFSGGLTPQTFYSMGLNYNLNANDKFEIKLVCPTWATPPTGSITVTLYFKSR